MPCLIYCLRSDPNSVRHTQHVRQVHSYCTWNGKKTTLLSLITREEEQEHILVDPVNVHNVGALYFHKDILRVNRPR